MTKNRLLALIRERFGVSTDPEMPPDCPPDRARTLRLKKNRELFCLVYHAVGETNPLPLTLNAQYGLFRVLLTMFGVLALLSLAGLAWALCCRPDARFAFGVWIVIFIAAMFLACLRCKKRGEDFAQSVYDLFMSNASGKPSSDKPA